MSTPQLDEFTRGYVESALICSDVLAKRWIADIDPSTLQQMIEDCQAFQESNSEVPEINSGRAGSDFFLTRNRHGAGFWDGDWDEPHGKVLTDCAHAYGTFELYEGDDGKVYSHG